MPEKLFADQFDDEEVLYVFRKHPVVMRRGLIYWSIALLLGTLPALIKPEPSYFFGGLAVGFLLSIVVFMPYWISWYYSIFIVTDQRLIQITQKGLFHKTVVDIGLKQIQMVNYQISGMQESLLGFGTVMMQTFMGDLVIHDVHHPADTQKKIINILKDHGIVTQSPPGMQDEMVELESDEEAT